MNFPDVAAVLEWQVLSAMAASKLTHIAEASMGSQPLDNRWCAVGCGGSFHTICHWEWLSVTQNFAGMQLLKPILEGTFGAKAAAINAVTVAR